MNKGEFYYDNTGKHPVITWTYFALENESFMDVTARRFVKIGKAERPEMRVHDLCTGNPRGLFLVAAIPANIEAKLHSGLRRYRVAREWYAADSSFWKTARDLVRALAPGVRSVTTKKDI